MSQINHVENPIINSPFEAPKFHWHLEQGRRPEMRDGRCLASYFFRVPERAARGRRAQRLFFAQLEAAKAVIFLNEATPDFDSHS